MKDFCFVKAIVFGHECDRVPLRHTIRVPGFHFAGALANTVSFHCGYFWGCKIIHEPSRRGYADYIAICYDLRDSNQRSAFISSFNSRDVKSSLVSGRLKGLLLL